VISLDDRPVGGLDPWLPLRDELSVALCFVFDFCTWSALEGIDGTNCSGDVDEICEDDSSDSGAPMVISFMVGIMEADTT